MAWFTAEANLEQDGEQVTFTAGTVVVNVDEAPEITTMEDRSIDNVNPGDCATICWNIRNVGTKRAELRVKVDSGWVDEVEEAEQEAEQVVFFAPKPDSGWVMYEDEEGLWLYYINGPVAPVAGDDEGVKLCLVVGFDGPSMDNRYQGLSYSIGGTVYAVQASNGAPEDLWGEAWEEVKSEGYTDDSLKTYFIEGRGASMPCWNPEQPEEPEEPEEPVFDHYSVNISSAAVKSELEWGPYDVKNKVAGSIYALDKNGNVLTGYNATITIRAYHADFANHPWTLPGTFNVTFVNGVASFDTGWYRVGTGFIPSSDNPYKGRVEIAE
jgi:hypothetical protein